MKNKQKEHWFYRKKASPFVKTINEALENIPRSKWDLIKQAGKHAIQVAKHATKTGEISASDEVQANRLAVCIKCEDYNKDKKSCNLCGCSLSGKIGNMIKYIGIKCKADRWQA